MTAKHTHSFDALLIDEKFDGDIYTDELLSKHTSYRIGGPAKYFVRVASVGALRSLLEACEENGISWMLLGRGTNVLVADEGYDGVAVSLGRDFRSFHYDEEATRFYAGAGVLLSALVQEAFHRSLAGLECAVGVPGTLGGALRMNAGTRDKWISEQVVSVTTYSPRFGFRKRLGSEFEWGYRSSSFGEDEVILEAEIAACPADPFYIRGKMEGSLSHRRKTQPTSLPSCGSVFKSPAGYSAGKMIEQLGLKGTQIGDAQISEQHANFIVNVGNASAHDVAALMKLIRDRVFEHYGTQLQPEVKLVGFTL